MKFFKNKVMDKETKELILCWFNHIEQMATDRKTLNGYTMDFQDCLDEIRVLAKNSQEYIKKHC